MYQLKNGLLYQDGKPIIAMGQSYYPSFHQYKYPAPPTADRVGLMKQDIALMRQAGFQFLRVAALGEVTMKEGEVQVDTPFVDEMVKEAHDQGMAVSIRLQGYAMNLRGHDDFLMRNHRDEEMDGNWASFMKSTMFHQGMIEDNLLATQALARHFKDRPGVVSYQMYNEPHYPGNGVFDYHPATLTAYQEWRKSQGLAPQEPPRRRPQEGESPEPWIAWRLFTTQAMSDFLNNTSDASKAGDPTKETYTCMTGSPLNNNNMNMGIDYFDNAARMDTVGITCYTNTEGATYYAAALQFAMAESAAALYGKHAWTIEIDARTHMPPRKTPEETYMLLAAGHKGIVYYEWRGDYADEGTPLPDNCGFLFNNGDKTEHHDRSVQMVQFVNKHSTLLAAAEKAWDGVGILYSKHAIAYGDAYLAGTTNLAILQLNEVYHQVHQHNLSPAILEARHLKENKLGLKVLFIPYQKEWLSDQEKQQLTQFQLDGGKVYVLLPLIGMGGVTPYGWWPWNEPVKDGIRSEFRSTLELEDVLDLCRITPSVSISSRHLKSGTLRGDGYSLVILTNTDPLRRDIDQATVTLCQPFTAARWLTPDEEVALPTAGKTVTLPPVREGGVLVLMD